MNRADQFARRTFDEITVAKLSHKDQTFQDTLAVILRALEKDAEDAHYQALADGAHDEYLRDEGE